MRGVNTMRSFVKRATAVAMGVVGVSSLGVGAGDASATVRGHELAMIGLAKRAGRADLVQFFSPTGSELGIAAAVAAAQEKPLKRNGFKHGFNHAEANWYREHGGFYADLPEWDSDLPPWHPNLAMLGEKTVLGEIIAKLLVKTPRQRSLSASSLGTKVVPFERQTRREQARMLRLANYRNGGRGHDNRRFEELREYRRAVAATHFA